MSPFIEKRYNVFEVAEREGVDVSIVHDWFKEGLKNTLSLADGTTEVAASDLRAFLDSRRKADVLPSAETHKGKPAKPQWHAHGRLTPAQCAEWQGVDRETVESWIRDGLRCETVGSTRFIWRADCKTFLATHGTQSPDTTGETRSESTGSKSVIVAEEYMGHGFFG